MELSDSWWSYRWFLWETLAQYNWEFANVLYLLGAIPLVVFIRSLLSWWRGRRLEIATTEKGLKSDPISYLRFVPTLFIMLSLVCLILALARPQKTNERIEQFTEGIDIMLMIDLSESMRIEDFRPNRMDAAKKVAVDFIKGRNSDRIGIVVFAGDAFSLSPLTTDYDLLLSLIKDIDFDMIKARGTAIGSALVVATDRMIQAESKSKVMILLSDGENTAGNVDPLTAARIARAYGSKIYSIGIGKEGQVPITDMLGRRVMIENNLDETALREIAKIGTGKFYRVTDNAALESVFNEIDQLERAEIKISRYRDVNDYYSVYLAWGIVFLLIWLFLKSTFMSNVIRD